MLWRGKIPVGVVRRSLLFPDNRFSHQRTDPFFPHVNEFHGWFVHMSTVLPLEIFKVVLNIGGGNRVVLESGASNPTAPVIRDFLAPRCRSSEKYFLLAN